MMTGRATRRALPGRTAGTIAALIAVGAVLLAPAGPPPASAQSSGLEVLGELALPPACQGEEPGTEGMKVIDIDTDAQRLYVQMDCGGDRLVAYDTSSEIPTPVVEGPPFSSTVRTWSSFTVLVSPELGRVLVLGIGSADAPIIEVFDLETLEHTGTTWEMTKLTPGFVPVALTHDPGRSRIYLLGVFEGSQIPASVISAVGSSGAVPTTAIVALEDTSGETIWTNPLRECDAPMTSVKYGSFVVLSARSMVYAFCRGGSATSQSFGQGGLARVDVSDQGNAEGVVSLPSDFFPVSGDYGGSGAAGGGVAALDPESERFFGHSLSDQTHGAWVFDGRRSSWIGFVAAPDNTNSYIGLDPSTGKHYMGGGTFSAAEGNTGYINVTDGSATPVPQGRLFSEIRSSTPWARDLEGSLKVDSNIMVDPSTGRLFVSYLSRASDGAQVRGVLVLRDTTPPITPRTPLDLDELTHNLADEDARLEFSANTSGFGVQYVQVGGWENAYTRPTVPGFSTTLADLAGDNPANIRYGNRGATMSLVERVGIALSGSSATAIATRPDDNTPADAENKQNEAAEPVGGLPQGDEGDDGDEGAEPAQYATCLDGVGEAVANKQGSKEEPAHAEVVCDLANLKATAHARFSGGSGGGGVVVSASSFDGRTFRDPDRGVVTEAEAIAEGVFFGEAEVGGFSIDRVTSTATTWAKGLDGRSHVKWVRTVEGVSTIEADGTAGEPTSCTTIVESGKEVVEEGDCESLQKELNELIPNRFDVRFPLPEVVATSGGAFASVQESESDFLSGQATNNDERRMVPGMELTVFADGDQRGRLWVQLAAVKADATFIRSPLPPPYEPPDTWTGGDGGGLPIDDSQPSDGTSSSSDEPSSGDTVAIPLPDQGDASSPGPDDPDVFQIASHEERLIGGFGWLPALRSAGDAALTGALYVLFLLPLAEVVRRRRLLDVLSDTPDGEARHSVPKPSVPLSPSPVGSTT